MRWTIEIVSTTQLQTKEVKACAMSAMEEI